MTLLVSELFDYTTGNLVGKNGGGGSIGWLGAWTGSSGSICNPQVNSGDQTFLGLNVGPASNTNKGKFWNKGDNSNAAFAHRSMGDIINDGSTYWIAYTVSIYGSKAQMYWQLDGFSTEPAGITAVNIMSTGMNAIPTQVLFQNGVLLFTGDINYTTHLIIIKIVSSGSSSVAVATTVYVDPNLSQDVSLWTPKTSSNTYYMKTPIDGWGYPNTTAATSSNDGYMLMDNFRIATSLSEAVGGLASKTNSFFPFFKGGRR